MTLTQISLLAFLGVASGGLLLVSLIALRRRIPAFLSAGHGLGGLAALALLFAAALQGEAQTPALTWWALGVLLSAFTGGMLLFRVIFRHRATLPLAALHGSLAALGIYLLYRAAV